MEYLIGTDEAGYAPNFGPLVISATVWEAPDGVRGEDLFERLAPVISERPERAAGCPRVAIADSKALYSPDRGLRHLERGLWATLGLLDHRPRCWRDVWQALAPDAIEPMRCVPWYADYDRPTPLDCDGEDLALLAEPLRAGLAAAGVRLVAMRSRAVFAHQFNDLIEQHGNKGAALSHETLALAARMIDPLPPAPVSVICDKHGGRNRYGDLLAEHFPDSFIEVHGEGGPRSTYRFGPADRRIQFTFRVRAEACLPAALASMASKYLRELAMRAFNDYWRGHLPGLEPTAGYPVDAKRFRAAIAQKQRQLKIDDRILWRQR
ncbi:MAG: hypothetical protein ABFC96_07015 [Thermoguttaceae bacterium]